MSLSTRVQLSAMMFLQFFVWGSWYVTAPNFLGLIGFTANDFGWTYAVGPIAGMLTPFFVGMVADRFFSAQRVMALMHLIGAGLILLATVMMKGGSAPSLINFVFLGYMMTYYPTLALSNTIAMRQMQDSKKEFPLIRVFGTIGWIVAGFALSFLSWDKTINMFYLCAGAAVGLAMLSLFLPDTTPGNHEAKISLGAIFGVDALVLLKNRSYLIFLVCSVLICIPLAFYYQLASRVVEMSQLPIALTMSYGQMSEIVFMLVMPFFFVRLGVKWMLALGMLAWVLRYALFAFGASREVAWMVLSGIVIHGICYDFFFVTGQIYTDKIAPAKVRAQAQGLLVFFTLGLGMFIGAKFAGYHEANFTPSESLAYADQVQEVAARIETYKMDAPGNQAVLSELTAKMQELRHMELKSLDWRMIWGVPAAMAAVILVFFTIVFREPNSEGPQIESK